MESETPGIAAARAAGIAFDVVRTQPPSTAEESAALQGIELGRLLRSIVVRRGKDDYVFVLVPARRQIDWAKLRTHLGVKRLSLPDQDEARAATGYERGAITPFGSARPWPVLLDASAAGGGPPGGGGGGPPPDSSRRALVSRQVEDLAGELRVKEVAISESPLEVAELRATPKLDLVGPRYGPNLPELRRLLSEGRFEVSNGTLRAGGFVLNRGEFTLDYTPREGWAVEHGDDYVVAVDTRLDDELVLEGRVYDLIRQVQRLRADSGLEITDRIVLTIPEAERDLLVYEDWIKNETLATSIEVGDSLAVRKAE
jgi:Cys-tRNA(Pro)/Cys-tRNA(Cys) deacylase